MLIHIQNENVSAEINTLGAELVSFKIQKEGCSSAGVRRIKAVIGAKPGD